jgi:hypothetical protein
MLPYFPERQGQHLVKGPEKRLHGHDDDEVDSKGIGGIGKRSGESAISATQRGKRLVGWLVAALSIYLARPQHRNRITEPRRFTLHQVATYSKQLASR